MKQATEQTRIYGWENWKSLQLIFSELQHRLQELSIYDPNGHEYREVSAEVKAIHAEVKRREAI